jgi:acyl dehydratase
MQLPPYRVRAHNSSKASENKIHDDATARRFGFRGGLVGGVLVYGYMSHQPLQRWRQAWLERGTATARFGKPVYEGDIAEVVAKETGTGPEGTGPEGTGLEGAGPEGAGLELEVHSAGVLCATGTAALAPADQPAPDMSAYKAVAPRADRQPANEATLPVGGWLGMTPLLVTEAVQAGELQDIGETDPIYAEKGLVHPCTLLRCCNWVLSHNVILPAWMHMGSAVRNIALARVGETLTARARVTRNYEHKGHKWVEIDAMVLADETRPVLQAMHIAIYHPRQLAEAA